MVRFNPKDLEEMRKAHSEPEPQETQKSHVQGVTLGGHISKDEAIVLMAWIEYGMQKGYINDIIEQTVKAVKGGIL